MPPAHFTMITADTHSHTCFSHGRNTPFEMHAQAVKKGLSILGFSEHSPRPQGYDYPVEYRETLNAHLGDYYRQVEALKASAGLAPQTCQVLLGMEIDWLDGEDDFIWKAVNSHPFDYLIGSVHFIGRWGYDADAKDWDDLSQEECENLYAAYFRAWRRMIESGLFQIAAHPDLIKIFSAGQFHVWLGKRTGHALVLDGLKALRDQGMALEISSAGLRKPCGEFYPAPPIAAIAAELGIPIALASDAHCVEDVASAFDDLAGYARSFGFDRQAVFAGGKMRLLPF